MELPPSTPWLKDFSWDVTDVRPRDAATAKRLHLAVHEAVADCHDMVKAADALLRKAGVSVPPDVTNAPSSSGAPDMA